MHDAPPTRRPAAPPTREPGRRTARRAPAVRGAELVDRLAEAVGAVERRETHGSWVLLTRTRALKVKKPVVMAFLDYGTPERRREMCRAEVEVNRRAAPHLYLGVRAIVADRDGVRLAPEDSPGALDYAVEMRRFAEADTLAARLRAGTVTPQGAAELGAWLAGFHARCEPVSPAGTAVQGGGAEAVKRALDDDFATLSSLLSADAGAARRLVAAERCAAALLRARWDPLDERARRGRVRDGHGDLRAEHVLLGPPHALVDAIEFDPGLRRIDTGLDLAFLVMDLHAAGRADLAAAMLRGYREAGGDAGDDRLLAFFAAYRARVRAKVALLRAAQLEAAAAGAGPAAPGPEAAEREWAAAERLLGLGERLLWVAREPVVLVLAGVSASGKSTLASALADRSGAPVVSSDVVRKRLAGVGPGEPAPAAAYAEDVSRHTYRELGRAAAGATGTVIVDATFHRRALRDAFREALGDGAARALWVECRAPVAVLERRLRARERDPARVSDATLQVLRHQLAAREPFDELPGGAHLSVRTDQPLEDVAAAIEEALDRREREECP